MPTEEQILTPEEQRQLEWCYSVLSEERIAECEEEADQQAYKEANAERAADTLMPILTKLKTAQIRQQNCS